MEHTPEPWQELDGNIRGVVADEFGYRDFIYEDWGRLSSADMRRIVACVNACAGMDIDYLEKFGTAGWVGLLNAQYEEGIEVGQATGDGPCE